MLTAVIEPAVDGLQKQTDLELVCEGAPAYLLMIDSMIESDPENEKMLFIGTQSYVGYLSALQECDPETIRLPALAEKSYNYSRRLLSEYLDLNANESEMAEQIEDLDDDDVPAIFWGAIGWLTWVQQQKGAPSAMADVVLLEKLMQRVLELDPAYQAGGAHLFMGGYLAIKPAMLGGNPELAKKHFEKALAYGNRTFLITQVTYAETYARNVFDKELHNALLQEVIDFNIEKAPEYTLSNLVAKRKAKQLLNDDYFLD